MPLWAKFKDRRGMDWRCGSRGWKSQSFYTNCGFGEAAELRSSTGFPRISVLRIAYRDTFVLLNIFRSDACFRYIWKHKHLVKSENLPGSFTFIRLYATKLHRRHSSMRKRILKVFFCNIRTVRRLCEFRTKKRTVRVPFSQLAIRVGATCPSLKPLHTTGRVLINHVRQRK